MATASGGATPSVTTQNPHRPIPPQGELGLAGGAPMAPASVERRLFTEGYAFDFFQAVRLLESLSAERRPVGQTGPPRAEAVRFRAHLSLSFPASSIYDLV